MKRRSQINLTSKLSSYCTRGKAADKRPHTHTHQTISEHIKKSDVYAKFQRAKKSYYHNIAFNEVKRFLVA